MVLESSILVLDTLIVTEVSASRSCQRTELEKVLMQICIFIHAYIFVYMCAHIYILNYFKNPNPFHRILHYLLFHICVFLIPQ